MKKTSGRCGSLDLYNLVVGKKYKSGKRTINVPPHRQKYEASSRSTTYEAYALIIHMTIEISKRYFKRKYYKARATWFRWNRLLFPSAAEVRFIEIMGGKIMTLAFIKHPQTRQPLRFVFSLGRALNVERFEREVYAGRYWLDFGNDILWAIEIDGKAYHRDVVKEQDKDDYLSEPCHSRCKEPCYKHSNMGWRVKHVQALRLWSEPAVVQHEVLEFLNI